MHVHGVLLGPDGKELFSQSNPGQVTLTGSIVDTSDNTLKTKAMGRNVEEVMLFNAIAFTDTTYKTSGAKDISKYREFSLLFTNSHDQTINLNYQIASTSVTPASTFTWNGTTFATPKSIAIQPGGVSRFYFKMDDLGVTRMPQKILFVLTPAAAPTTGSITGVLMGVPN